VLDAVGYADLRAEQAARRERGDAMQIGIGVSVFVEITGGGAFKESAAVEVHPDGTVTVLTGTSPHGQGHATAWAMLASEHLDIPVEKITVKHGDTDLIPRGSGTMGSRSLQTGGVAVYQAAGELVEVAKQRAADLLEANADDLVVERGAVVVRGTDTPCRSPTSPTREAARRHPLRLGGADVPVRRARGRRARRRGVGQGGHRQDRHHRRRRPRPQPAAGRGANGTAASRRASRRRCSRRSSTTRTATPVTATFADYGIPSAAELPSFTLLDMATPTHLNPLGVKGIGEAGTIGATPAAQSAVIDALAHLGVRHIDMPLTPAAGVGSDRGSEVKVEITVNGASTSADVEPRLLLAHYLRDVLGLKATKSAATPRPAARAPCCSTASP
jgi:carbon-monoxide dehydrogenase large subunit